MKLFDKYNRLNITATILTFVVGSCAFYLLINYILLRQLDESLKTEQQEIVSFVNKHDALPEITPTKDQYIQFNANKGDEIKIKNEFLTLKKKHEKEEENYRELQFVVKAGDKHYTVLVDKPLEETEALLQVIIGVTIAMIAIILLVGYLINRTVIRRLWKPFYLTIDQVKNYHLADQSDLKLENSEIDEFSLLNQSINEMTERIQKDYGSLKNFTGQAAHEMQTPLAVIRTKLDTLIQNETVLEKNAQHIVDIEKAVQRLSRLHQSLLLLTKVENRQFQLNEELRLDNIIRDKCAEYSEMAESLNLNFSLQIDHVTIKFHHHLAEILINNLLNNAIRYNKAGGGIEICLTHNNLSITNTSETGQLDAKNLFKRFYRGQNSEDGTGLGLSIVKQICDLADYTIEYQYVNSRHDFTIHFNRG